MKLLQALDGFLLDKRIEGLSPRPLEGYERQIQLLADFLGNPRAEDITVDDLRRFFDYLRNEYTPHRRVGKKGEEPCGLPRQCRAQGSVATSRGAG